MLDIDRPDLTLGAVGAGAMGRGIAQVAAAAGIPVRLYDARSEAIEDARAFIRRMLDRAVERGRMGADAAAAAVGRLNPAARLDDLAGCHVVVEAVVEDLEIKRRLFHALEGIVGEEAVLATNTSSLSVTRIAAACRRPERVAGFHFFNPVPLMRVVEVIDGERTDPAVGGALSALARRMGHRPVRAKDTPGFLVNHAGRGYGQEALRIVGEGVASHAEVDRVLREAAGFPMGPFELMDLTGLDVSHAVMESIYRQFYDEPRFRPAPETARRVAAGLFGRKAGEGFYRYREGKPQTPPEPPSPDERPAAVWIDDAEPEGRERLAAFLGGLPERVAVETAAAPSADALCLVTPLGADATTAAAGRGLDPRRTVAVDTLIGLERRITCMATPVTEPRHRRAARGLLGSGGVPVTPIADSPGFIVQRVLAMVVNIACDIAQQGIATPADIDDAVRLGLGYPKGPLSWGDEIGSERLLRVLERLQATTGDPRWRPSLWLRRRALLGVSLRIPDAAQ
ncbi:MAG TPA: 3-hydroxyacyl-CoA dehydrogenase [Geminicoccaceae bacterium]|nr:3-hydroxyacyl-CoA dehydrogenase [Geminicoccaceae bacterium]